MALSKFPTTVYDSSNFLESAGTVLFKLSTRQIVFLHHKKRDEWVLSKGRRDIGESRELTAVRETEEETGFRCRLLPVTMTTKQPRPGYDDVNGGAGRQENICEPFMVVHRVLKDETMKMIWWYMAAIDENAEVDKCEPQFVIRLVDFEQALKFLTFDDDRKIVAKAVEIFKETFDKNN